MHTRIGFQTILVLLQIFGRAVDTGAVQPEVAAGEVRLGRPAPGGRRVARDGPRGPQRERSVKIKSKIKKNRFWKLNQYDPEN